MENFLGAMPPDPRKKKIGEVKNQVKGRGDKKRQCRIGN
jgi:hypothetical protein